MVISVVVPCFNEEEVIGETYRRLAAHLEALCTDRDQYEILFVNDGSQDRTLELLRSICDQHANAFPASRGEIRVLPLARNFGHQLAISAGLERARGDAIVAMDADLQDPPEVIGEMLQKWREGADVVYGQRIYRGGESWFKLTTATLFYKLLTKITKIHIPANSGDFRLISKRVNDTLREMPERARFLRGMIPWIGYKQVAVNYERAARFAGETKYPLQNMLRLALDAIASFSQTPLRLAYLSGFLVAGVSFVLAIFILYRRLTDHVPVEGWASVMVTILFLGAVQLITVGILGEYIGRIYEQVKGRPLFIINEEESFSSAAASATKPSQTTSELDRPVFHE